MDGLNHGYEANFAGGFLNGVVLPSGVYIGMEDLPGGGDLDYNDNTFLFTNSLSLVPPPLRLLQLLSPEASSFSALACSVPQVPFDAN